MRSAFFSILLCGIFLPIGHIYAQKRLIVMGSSTAAGTGASNTANSFVGRLTSYYRQNMNDGQDTIVTNIAVGGMTTYQENPNGLAPVQFRPYPPDQDKNINRALQLPLPDVVLINLPTNDMASGFSKEEYMFNLNRMFDTVRSRGVKCFITTTQPRTQLSDVQRQGLRSLVDSIKEAFGIYAIDFWTDLATTDGLNNIKPAVSAGDNVHVNDAGHNFLFMKVRDKQVFSTNIPLPVRLTAFNAFLKNSEVLLSWRTEQEEANTVYEVERSADGISFTALDKQRCINGSLYNSYTFTDRQPLHGNGFYRLKVTEPGKTFYSKTISINSKAAGININKIYQPGGSGDLIAEVSIQKSQVAEVNVFTNTGLLVQKKTLFIGSPSAALPVGQYFLKISSAENEISMKAFNKL